MNQVLAGEDAQDIIERNLSQSDAVIFLDTPKSGESEWMAKEIRIALAMHLPIVWVKIGPDTGRSKPLVQPADRSHFNWLELNPASSELEPSLVDELVHKAFEISREFSKNVFDSLRQLRSLSNINGVEITELDRNCLTYRVQIPRHEFRYNQRPMTHLLGFYGRYPKEEDKSVFMTHIEQLGYEPHPTHGHVYDAALILAPIPSQAGDSLVTTSHTVDSYDTYLNCLQQHLRSTLGQSKRSKRGVIISGAFPDCEPQHQQHIIDAIHAFTQTIFDNKMEQ